MPRFNFGDPPKSKNAPFWNKKSIEFELTIQIFFGCKSKSFEARRLLIQTLYGMLLWNLSKSAHNSDIQGTGVIPPPILISNSERPYWKGLKMFIAYSVPCCLIDRITMRQFLWWRIMKTLLLVRHSLIGWETHYLS